MTWGYAPWGIGPWGGAAPVIDLVTTPWGGAIIDILGGDVILIAGSGFYDPVTVEVLDVGLTVVGTCFVFDPRYDVSRSRIFCGTPALAAGTYSVRVTTGAGDSTFPDALSPTPLADQLKVERARVGFSRPWVAGRRVLRGGA